MIQNWKTTLCGILALLPDLLQLLNVQLNAQQSGALTRVTLLFVGILASDGDAVKSIIAMIQKEKKETE